MIVCKDISVSFGAKGKDAGRDAGEPRARMDGPGGSPGKKREAGRNSA